MFLGRHGPVGVLEAGAGFGFALVEHVPVVERGHGARRWDDEGVARGWCLGYELRDMWLWYSLRCRMDDLVGHLVGESSVDLAGCLVGYLVGESSVDRVGCLVGQCGGLHGPDLVVRRVRHLACESMGRCCIRPGLELTELALEWARGSAVHALAGLVQVSVAGNAWWS